MNKLKYFPVVFLGLLLLVLPVCGWSPNVKISTHEDNINNSDEYPEIAVDALGNSYVVWYCCDGEDCWNGLGDYEIYWVKVDSSGTPGTVQKISTHPDNENGSDKYPHISIDALGNSYVVWGGWDGSNRGVYWVKVDAAGVPGTVQKISTYPDTLSWDSFSHPQIAADASGNSYVTWHGRDGNFPDPDIHWVKIDATGVQGTVQILSILQGDVNMNGYAPKIAADTSGNSYVTWFGRVQTDWNDSNIYWVKIDAAGVPGTLQKISTHPDTMEKIDKYPEIAVDILGNSYVVWRGCDDENCIDELGDPALYWTKVDAAGVPGTVQLISTHPYNIGRGDWDHQIGVDSSGNSYVTWWGWDEIKRNVYWVKMDAAGVPGTVQIISNLGRDSLFPQIAVDASGNSYVVWCGDGGVYWVKVDAAGVPGIVKPIGGSSSPHMAIDASGNSYVVSRHHDGNDYEIIFTSNYSIPITFGSMAELFHDNTFLIAGDNAHSTDVLGSAKIAHALGQAGTVNPEGRTETILTPLEHDTGNLIPVGGPAVSPIADEFNGYFGITYNYDPDVNRVFEIFWDTYSITLNLDNYPGEDICIVYLDEHNGRNVLLVWGYGWQGTYAGSSFIGDLTNWSLYADAHMAIIRWIDLNADGLVQSNEITVEQYA